MRRLEVFLFRDWQYKLISLLMGTILWFFVTLGERVPMSIERSIEVYNKEQGYEYKLERKRARVRLKVMERFVTENMIEAIGVGVNVKGIKEGEYTLRVEVKDIPKFLITIERIEPEFVKVKVIKAPKGGN
ncbi:hypothetical protein IAE16_06180 [Hydrogenobacter sp. T-2]|uniref:hypothetical protein n=1 Tax=Pampinifervens diazotrophicum TaxID=1632018 RepID=UPI002B2583E7|nr:hypothetical protein [Hydrogenobacter sp. T-2]WPM31405.1 hypothetical protein IAE16_06180 [Hydrogenobacter sp. T-2]